MLASSEVYDKPKLAVSAGTRMPFVPSSIAASEVSETSELVTTFPRLSCGLHCSRDGSCHFVLIGWLWAVSVTCFTSAQRDCRSHMATLLGISYRKRT